MKKTVIVALLVCILAAAAAFNNFAYQEQICVNGTVYTQNGDNIAELPSGSIELGYLKGIFHKSIDSPSEDFTGTNLNEKYAGCPIYKSGEAIYLKDYGGFYVQFRYGE